MQDLYNKQDGFQRSVASDIGSNVAYTSDVIFPEETLTCRQKLGVILSSKGTLFIVSVLIVLDCVVVILYLMIEVGILQVGDGYHFLQGALHLISITILGVFVVEIFLRIYAKGLDFFKSVFEVIDALVIIVSIVLDIIFIHYGTEQQSAEVQVVIILRFWRVTRILNGIIVTVRYNARQSIAVERRTAAVYQRELLKYKQYSVELADEIERLHLILLESKVEYAPNIIPHPT